MKSSCLYIVSLVAACPGAFSTLAAQPAAAAPPPPPPVQLTSRDVTVTKGSGVQFTVTGGDPSLPFQWSGAASGSTGATVMVTFNTPGPQQVFVYQGDISHALDPGKHDSVTVMVLASAATSRDSTGVSPQAATSAQKDLLAASSDFNLAQNLSTYNPTAAVQAAGTAAQKYQAVATDLGSNKTGAAAAANRTATLAAQAAQQYANDLNQASSTGNGVYGQAAEKDAGITNRLNSALVREVAVTSTPHATNHFFVWLGYEMANPYLFTPPSTTTTTTNSASTTTTTTTGSTTTTTTSSGSTTTTTPTKPAGNGTIQPKTTSNLLLEADYVNRLAWDPVRQLVVSNESDVGLVWSALYDPKYWDFEAQAFFSMNTPTSSSSGGSSGTTQYQATSLVGTGDFGVEGGMGQNFWLLNTSRYNFQTVDLEERFWGITDRSTYHSHREEFLGLGYNVGYMVTKLSTDPVRLTMRAGIDWMDSVTFVPSYLGTNSTSVATQHNSPVYVQAPYLSYQGSVTVPIGQSNYLEAGGRLYFGPSRHAAPWSSYVGYSIPLDNLFKTLGLPSNSSTPGSTGTTGDQATPTSTENP